MSKQNSFLQKILNSKINKNQLLSTSSKYLLNGLCAFWLCASPQINAQDFIFNGNQTIDFPQFVDKGSLFLNNYRVSLTFTSLTTSDKSIITNIIGTGASTDSNSWSKGTDAQLILSYTAPVTTTIEGKAIVSSLQFNIPDSTLIFGPQGISGKIVDLDKLYLGNGETLSINSSEASGNIDININSIEAVSSNPAPILDFSTIKDRDITFTASTYSQANGSSTSINSLSTSGEGKVTFNNSQYKIFKTAVATFAAANNEINHDTFTIGTQGTLSAGSQLTTSATTNFQVGDGSTGSFTMEKGSKAILNGQAVIYSLGLKGAEIDFSNNMYNSVVIMDVNKSGADATPDAADDISVITGLVSVDSINLKAGATLKFNGTNNVTLKTLNAYNDSSIVGNYNFSGTMAAWSDISSEASISKANNTFTSKEGGFIPGYTAKVESYNSGSGEIEFSELDYAMPLNMVTSIKDNANLTLPSWPIGIFDFGQNASLTLNLGNDIAILEHFAWSSENALSTLVIADNNNSEDRRLIIGPSIFLNVSTIRPKGTQQHYLVFNNNIATAVPQIGTADHKFKAVGVQGGITIDKDTPYLLGKTIYADNLLILGEVSFNSGTIPISEILIGDLGAFVVEQSVLPKISKVMSMVAGRGTFYVQNTTSNTEASILPAIGSADAAFGHVTLDHLLVSLGEEQPYIDNLAIIDSTLDLGVHQVKVKGAAFIGHNILESTVVVGNSGVTNGKLTITDSIEVNDGATLSLVVSSDSHIPAGELVVIESEVGLDALKIAELTNQTRNSMTLSVSDSKGGMILDGTTIPVGNNTYFSDVSAYVDDKGNVIIKTVTNEYKVQETVNDGLEALNTPELRELFTIVKANMEDEQKAADLLVLLKKLASADKRLELLRSFSDAKQNMGLERRAITGVLVEKPQVFDSLNNDHRLALQLPSAGEEDERGYYVWVKSLMGSGRQSPITDFAGFEQQNGGVVLGIGKTINERVLVGGAASLMQSGFLYLGEKNGDRVITTSKALYLYGNYNFTEQLALNTTLSYGKTTVDNYNFKLVDVDKVELGFSTHDARTLSGTAKLGYTKHLSSIYDLTFNAGITHGFIFDDAYAEKGAGLLNYVVDAQKSSKTIISGGASLLANYEKFVPEVHANVYYISDTIEKVKFGLEWLSSNVRFTSDQPVLPKMQYNVGFNIGANLTDNIYTEVGADLYWAHKYHNKQGFLSIKWAF